MDFEGILELSELVGNNSGVLIIEGVWSKMRYSIGHNLSFFGWSRTILACVTHSKYKLILNKQNVFTLNIIVFISYQEYYFNLQPAPCLCSCPCRTLLESNSCATALGWLHSALATASGTWALHWFSRTAITWVPRRLSVCEGHRRWGHTI